MRAASQRLAIVPYCARPPFALERLSITRDASGRISRIHYALARHKAATWVGPGRGRNSTRPGANGVIELSPFEFLDPLADLVPPPRKHRHRYHGVFAPNHKLRRAVMSLATAGHRDPVKVVKRVRCTKNNLRRQMGRILKRAGIKQWPKLFQNLRSTRETELVQQGHPVHVVCAWLGNTPRVADKHYLQVTDEDFQRALLRCVSEQRAG